MYFVCYWSKLRPSLRKDDHRTNTMFIHPILPQLVHIYSLINTYWGRERESNDPDPKHKYLVSWKWHDITRYALNTSGICFGQHVTCYEYLRMFLWASLKCFADKIQSDQPQCCHHPNWSEPTFKRRYTTLGKKWISRFCIISDTIKFLMRI